MNDLFEPIAIIGMSARVPGANDVSEFWSNLAHGRETVSFPDDESLLAVGVRPEELADPSYVRAVPLMPDVAGFDADLFGMSVREAELLDPQIRAFLEITHAALLNAGYDPYRIGGSVGVFGTTGPTDYLRRHVLRRPELVHSAGGLTLMVTNNLDYLATLASYKLDLKGPSFTVLSACSSSLVALNLAQQSLRLGECDMAVVGGAHVHFPYGHGYRWTPGGIMSRDGHCRALDASATGTIFGSGAAAVVVKRLDDALADGDDIRAVIAGIAVNNDGAVKSSFSAPSVAGQAAVISEAMSLAGFGPRDMSYVEMHATGTLLGDPSEIAGLTRAFTALSQEPLEPGSCVVGSVKSNVGHLVSVAGLASLLKVVLSLENELLPPSINISEPNPKLNLDRTPFIIDDRPRPWRRDPAHPRRAGVSSFGVGGTNAHMVLEEAPARRAVRGDGRPRITVWSAKTHEAEGAQRAALTRFFAELDEDRFPDATATLQQGRTPYGVRGALVSTGAAATTRALAGPVTVGEAAERTRVVFAFPDARASGVGPMRMLYGAVPAFTVALDEIVEQVESYGSTTLQAWLEGRADDGVSGFMAQLALAHTWRAWGLEPDEVVGAGTGAFAAAVAAGALDVEQAVKLLSTGAPPPTASLGQSAVPCHVLAADSPLEVPQATDGATVLVMDGRSTAGDHVPALDPEIADGHVALLATAARLWTAGHALDWRALDPARPVRRIALPGYPYQRRRSWIDLPDESGMPARPAHTSTGNATTPQPAEDASPADAASPRLTALTWTESPTPAPAAAQPRTAGDALVLLPPGEPGNLVMAALRMAGYTPLALPWHDPAAREGDVLDRLAGDAARLEQALAAIERPPILLVHATTVDTWTTVSSGTVDEQLRRSFWSLFHLVQRASHALHRLPEIVVLTRESADVSGSEPVSPVKATLHGLIATLRQELPRRSCRLVDVGARTTPEDLAAELRAAHDDGLVALRGERRWTRGVRPLPAPSPGQGLREEGHYLITGGLGGLGLALARGLAETGLRPRLSLLGRRALGESEAGVTDQVEEIRALGAHVEVLTGDVTDGERLRLILDDLTRAAGPLHGVFHLAGLPGGGLVQLRDPQDALDVLRPKVHGTVALEEALRGRPVLDFTMLFASQAGVHGVLGSADYAAANSFQDASATAVGFTARRVIAVDWPVWADVGMAARSSVDVSELAAGRVARRTGGNDRSLRWERTVSATDTWFLDEHRLDQRPFAPGTALVTLFLQSARELGLVDTTAVLEDVVFGAPLLACGPCQVRVDLHPEGSWWRGALSYRLGDGEWLHSSTVRLSGGPSGAQERRADLSEFLQSPPATVRPSVSGRAGRLTFGPRWSVVEKTWLRGSDIVAHLRLPAAFTSDLDEYPLHPALLDMATGLLCHHRAELLLPFSYRRITVHDKLPAEFHSHVHIREDTPRALVADVVLVSFDGRILVEVEGFTMLVKADDEPPEAARRPRPVPLGLRPREGVEIALGLLAGPAPAQVMVSAGPAGAQPPPAAPERAVANEPADVAATLRTIWASVFGQAEVSDDDDFYAVGGDSLAAVELLGHIRDEFGVELNTATVFETPTVRELAEAIEETIAAERKRDR
ncbi:MULTISPECIES: SDR family NAD(P)-dependent oxidoreductase [unclassified Nonomuraea]|uniref:SDR family NAD(P)-dependent oxidoreductase n=1 Tax=unclassified Nonomuraea TaxID=2593643 RepID=UPI001378DA05|nr:SDR family NAD(P)-dependent oxidoreductase [Nonomuraea sp. KC401]NBE97995.1 SDR family NAD(P)-dependent oxidoreductase [Nonomuraea sp. K271]